MFVACQLNTGAVVFSDFMVKLRCLSDIKLSEVSLLALPELLDDLALPELLDELAPPLDLSLLLSGSHPPNSFLD